MSDNTSYQMSDISQYLYDNLLIICGTCIITYKAEFLIGFEAWTKLAQQWLVCAPLGRQMSFISFFLLSLFYPLIDQPIKNRTEQNKTEQNDKTPHIYNILVMYR